MRRVYSIVFFCMLPALAFCQPAGKWHAGMTLPGLSSSGIPPKLLFADSLLGYYIGVDTGFVTHDGGMSWTMMNFPSNARPSPTFLFAPSHRTVISFQKLNRDSNGISYPGIIKSTDMGNTWSLVSATVIPNAVKSFAMWSDNDGFRIWGDDVTGAVSSAATHDGGITFSEARGDGILQKYDTNLVAHGNGKYKATVNCNTAWSDSLHGAISIAPLNSSDITPYPVLTTTNGGRAWTETFPKYNGSTGYSHSAVYLIPGSQTIWTIPSVPKTAIYYFYSTDFGATWQTTVPFNKRALGTNTKPGVVQLAPVTATETWAILASDTEHPDLQHFIGYHDLSAGWSRDTVFTLQGAGFFGYSLNQIQFTDQKHGWALLTQTYFDAKQGIQVTKDSSFIFIFNSAPAVKDVRVTNKRPLGIFPNPASTVLRVNGLEDNEMIRGVTLYSLLGIEMNSPASISGDIDIRTLAPGYYFLRVLTNQRTETIPVVVTR